MSTLQGILFFLARLLTASQGVHTSPFGYFRELTYEARRNRSRRVRRYAEVLPAANAEPLALPASPIPAPRKPVDVTRKLVPVSVLDAEAVAEPADVVRGFYRAFERRQVEKHADRQRLGVAVLMDVATAAQVIA